MTTHTHNLMRKQRIEQKYNLKPWKPRQEIDAFKIFLIVEFWLLLLGVGVAFFALWWGLGLIGLVLTLFGLALLVGGF